MSNKMDAMFSVLREARKEPIIFGVEEALDLLWAEGFVVLDKRVLTLIELPETRPQEKTDETD